MSEQSPAMATTVSPRLRAQIESILHRHFRHTEALFRRAALWEIERAIEQGGPIKVTTENFGDVLIEGLREAAVAATGGQDWLTRTPLPELDEMAQRLTHLLATSPEMSEMDRANCETLLQLVVNERANRRGQCGEVT